MYHANVNVNFMAIGVTQIESSITINVDVSTKI